MATEYRAGASQDGDHYHVRFYKKTQQIDSQTGRPVWDSLLRGWATEEELKIFKDLAVALNVQFEIWTMPTIAGLGDINNGKS